MGVRVRQEPGRWLALCRPNLRRLSRFGGVERESPTGMACISVWITHNGVIDMVMRVVTLVDQPLARARACIAMPIPVQQLQLMALVHVRLVCG